MSKTRRQARLDKIAAELEHHRELRAALDVERARLARELVKLARAGHRAGLTPSEIARLAGVSRQSVHAALKSPRG